MNKTKSLYLYDVIFPFWLMVFFPPFVLVALAANWVIDAGIIWLHLKSLKLERKRLLKFIFASWALGFAADLVGGAILVFIMFTVPPEIGRQFNEYNPFSNVLTFILFMAVIAFVGCLIWIINRWLGKKFGLPAKTTAALALRMAIYTAPWLLLMPTITDGQFFHL